MLAGFEHSNHCQDDPSRHNSPCYNSSCYNSPRDDSDYRASYQHWSSC